MRSRLLFPLVLLAAGCGGDPPAESPIPLQRLEIDRTYLRDDHGRYIKFHGVNASCTKIPASIDEATGESSYIGRPFAPDKIDKELGRIRDAGLDSIRLQVYWEGVEPSPGKYDTEYLAYLRTVIQRAGDFGLHVLVDMHQDMFSRHLAARFNEHPKASDAPPGSLQYQILSLGQDFDTHAYNGVVQGDGAPAWAVGACLQEKKMDSPFWGTPRLLSGLDADKLKEVWDLYNTLTGGPPPDPNDPLPEWAVALALSLPGKFPVNESTDLLPFTHWGVAHALSLDLARCYACLFAGKVAFPNLEVGDQNVQDYLQDHYAAAWAEVAKVTHDLDNIQGYDLMNEPSGNFLVLTAVAAVVQAGVPDAAREQLQGLLGDEKGEALYEILTTLRLLPPDNQPETLKLWGLDQLNVLSLFGLNNGFDDTYLRPFYEKTARAILEVDPRAMFYIEGSKNISNFIGGANGGLGGMWEVPMQHPMGDDLANRFVWAPHWYADIYPSLGFNVDPRKFTVEEVRYRDYTTPMINETLPAQYSLGNIPYVYGEFGTYFNFNNYVDADRQFVNVSHEQGYAVSAAFLDNYYEALEKMNAGRMLWCYSPDNDERQGDWWDHEDFSILGFDQKLRAESAWARPHARALAGKPISTHFYSDHHYFDPDKGVPNPLHEFEVRYGSKETDAPTEIVVPRVQYPDGFYVWVSDGTCYFDAKTSTLYHRPSRDEPGFEHYVILRMPQPDAGQENIGWSYFFKDDTMVGGAP